MLTRLLALVAASLCIVGVAAKSVHHAHAHAPPTPPSFGNQLYIRAVMRLPYAGIIEPIEAWLNQDRMRVEYYGQGYGTGLDTYIFRQDLNTTWQVNPQIDTETCVETDGEVDLNNYFPDTTGFILQTDAVQVNDQMCDSWQLSVTKLNKTSVYNLYMSRTTGSPVRYQMMGYDSLIGSHFDLYQLDYLNVTVGGGIFPDGAFDHPAGNCGGFPGPGAFHINPLDEIAQYYPGNLPEGIVSDEYAAYMESHGKSYDDVTELRAREMRYHANKHFISSHQRQFRMGKATYTVGLNFLADHTADEMAARRGRLRTPKGQKKGNNAAGYHLRNYYDADLPQSVDWRQQGAVTAPQDQGICGSCWSFGSTGAIEGAYFLKYGALKVMAEQELMDCSWNFGNNACDGGEDYRAYDWILQNGGMSFKENYGPYLMQDGYCQASGKTVDVSLQSYVNTTEGDEGSLMDALASVGPVSISIDASHPGLSFYTSGVYYDPDCKNDLNDLDHSVLAVGYGTDADGDYWIVKNSWSTYWGDQGYIKMSRKNNNCGVATAPTYVILN